MVRHSGVNGMVHVHRQRGEGPLGVETDQQALAEVAAARVALQQRQLEQRRQQLEQEAVARRAAHEAAAAAAAARAAEDAAVAAWAAQEAAAARAAEEAAATADEEAEFARAAEEAVAAAAPVASQCARAEHQRLTVLLARPGVQPAHGAPAPAEVAALPAAIAAAVAAAAGGQPAGAPAGVQHAVQKRPRPWEERPLPPEVLEARQKIQRAVAQREVAQQRSPQPGQQQQQQQGLELQHHQQLLGGGQAAAAAMPAPRGHRQWQPTVPVQLQATAAASAAAGQGGWRPQAAPTPGGTPLLATGQWGLPGLVERSTPAATPCQLTAPTAVQQLTRSHGLELLLGSPLLQPSPPLVPLPAALGQGQHQLRQQRHPQQQLQLQPGQAEEEQPAGWRPAAGPPGRSTRPQRWTPGAGLRGQQQEQAAVPRLPAGHAHSSRLAAAAGTLPAAAPALQRTYAPQGAPQAAAAAAAWRSPLPPPQPMQQQRQRRGGPPPPGLPQSSDPFTLRAYQVLQTFQARD